MAGPKYKWTIKARNILEPIMADMDFLKEIERMRAGVAGERLRLEVRYWLMPTFGIPLNCYEFVLHYIETLEKDYSRVRPPVYVISDLDKTITPSSSPADEYSLWQIEAERFDVPKVALALEPTITKDEFLEFAERLFRDLVEPKLAALRGTPNKRVNAKLNIKRDALVDYLLSEGKSPKQIASYLNTFKSYGATLTAEDIRQIGRRYKSPKQDS